MKIEPESEIGIRLETSKATFEVYETVGGGLEIVSQDGKTVRISGCVSPPVIGARRVVIEEE